MNKLTKKNWIELAVSLGVLGILACVSAFYDLQINQKLYSPDSLFAQYFAYVGGEFPSYFCIPFLGAFFFYAPLKNKKTQILLKVVCSILVVGGYFFIIDLWLFKNLFPDYMQGRHLYGVILTLFMSVLTLLIFKFVSNDKYRKFAIFALFLLAVASSTNLVIAIAKEIWARQRFRTMTPENPINAPLIDQFVTDGNYYQGFTPWYLPQSIFKLPIRTDEYMKAYKAVDSDSFRSFPSGHTGSASVVFALVYLPELYKSLRKFKPLFWILSVLYVLTVAISRIIMGAHYLSDVSFAFFIGLGINAFWLWLFNSKKTKIHAKLNVPIE